MKIPDAKQAELIEEIMLRWERQTSTNAAAVRTLTIEEVCAEFEQVDEVVVREVERRVSALSYMDRFLEGNEFGDAIRSTWDGKTLTIEKTFKVHHAFAHGGRSSILRATDETLQRDVAIKTLRNPDFETRTGRQRLVQEAETIGELDHPGILPVYDLGTTDNGVPFYSMPIVDGCEMSVAIGELHQQPNAIEHARQLRKLLRSFISICQTTAYTHSRNIVHRDIKPANIMLGRFGEAFLVDWGLCKRSDQLDSLDDSNPDPVESYVNLTSTNESLGTPAFMSPEQARGEPNYDSKLSDIFNLGATLYTVLTGCVPYPSEHMVDLLAAAKKCEFVPPRKSNPGIPRPLEAICLKAMAADPASRHANPAALVDDLERWFADEPVSCLSETFVSKSLRFGRRYSQAISIFAIAVAVLVVVTGSLAVLINTQKLRADQNAQLAWQTVNDSVTEFRQNELLSFRGFRPLRDQLVKSSLDKYETLLSLKNRMVIDPVELAGAYVSTGQLYLDKSDFERAAASLQMGLDIFEQNSNWNSAADDAAWLTSGWADQFRIAIETGNDELQTRILRRFDIVWEKFPDCVQVAQSRLDLFLFLAESQLERNDMPGAIETMSAIDQMLQQLNPEIIENVRHARLALVRAMLNQKQRRLEKAAAQIEECLETLRLVHGATPRNLAAVKLRLSAFSKIANICRSTDDKPKLVKELEELARFLEQQIALFPSIDEFRTQLQTVALELATEYNQQSRWLESLDVLEVATKSGAIDGQEELRAAYAKTLVGAGKWHRDNGRNNEALAALLRARKTADEGELPLDSQTLTMLGQSLLLIGSDQWMVGSNLESVKSFEESESVFELLVSQDPSPMYRELLAVSIMAQALSNALAGNITQATEQSRKTIAELKRIAEDQGLTDNLNLGLETCHFLLATSLEKEGDPAFQQIADEGKKYVPSTLEGVLQLARSYALESQLYGRGQRQFRDTDRYFLHRYHRKVVELLETAVELGFDDFGSVREDPAYFGVFRDDAFRELVLKEP